MLSRTHGDGVKIIRTVPEGELNAGCCACCRAPEECPSLSFFPCCDLPSYILNGLAASRYIYIRENSLEWNDPKIRRAGGMCCGSACCALEIEDDVSVIYFDDSTFNDVRNDTRCMNEFLTFVVGGRGEKVRIENRFGFGVFHRGRSACCCVPVFFPATCFPCARKHVLFVDNAETAVKTIIGARNDAKARMQIDRE